MNTPYRAIPRRRLRRRWKVLILLPLLASVIAIVWDRTPPSPVPTPPPAPQQQLFDYPDAFALRIKGLNRTATAHYTIRPGDTLRDVMDRLQVPADSVSEWEKLCQGAFQVDALQPDDEVTVHRDVATQQPVRVIYSSIDGATCTFQKVGEAWQFAHVTPQPSVISESVRGTIHGTLFDSALEAGLPANLILALADLFACQVDFTTDIQEDDSFAVHFEEQVQGGRRLQCGPILAAEMVVSGQRYQAVLFEFPDGYKDYFDAEGQSLRTRFLKAPLSFSRISSTFALKRLHPILKVFRPHLGIDYAAPEGTPISALGDGTVTYVGRKGGFGRYVEIRHGDGYKSAYGHLSRFAAGLRAGRRVNQGDLIGYVGATGLATGPHLDFRFFKHGKPIDFLKAEFPHARSVPKALWTEFEKRREAYRVALESHSAVRSRHD